MNNRTIVLGIFLVIVFICLAETACADGGIVWHVDYDEHVYLPEQKAVLFWDKTNETMILSSKLQAENLTDMAWMIPIYSSTAPNVTAGDTELFNEIATAFGDVEFFGNTAQRTIPFCYLGILIFLIAIITFIVAFLKRKTSSFRFYTGLAVIFLFISLLLGLYVITSLNLMGVSSDNSSVQVIETKKVDIYDIAILQSSNASELFSWLHDHNYFVSTSTHSTVQAYCNQSNAYFVVNRINLTNKYSNETEISQAKDELQKGIATPLQIKFQPNRLYYPMKLTSINPGNTKINVYVIADFYVHDTSQLLHVEDTTYHYFGEDHSNHLTWLTFEGSTSKLTKDSFFEEIDTQQ